MIIFSITSDPYALIVLILPNYDTESQILKNTESKQKQAESLKKTVHKGRCKVDIEHIYIDTLIHQYQGAFACIIINTYASL